MHFTCEEEGEHFIHWVAPTAHTETPNLLESQSNGYREDALMILLCIISWTKQFWLTVYCDFAQLYEKFEFGQFILIPFSQGVFKCSSVHQNFYLKQKFETLP